MLISVTNLFIGLAVIPFFNFATQQTLRIGHVPYITLTNLGQILTHDHGVAAVLTLLRLLLLLFVYWQFTFLILGIQNIHRQTRLSFFQLAIATLKKPAA